MLNLNVCRLIGFCNLYVSAVYGDLDALDFLIAVDEKDD